MLREGHRRLSGMPKQEHANVMSDTVGKIVFSVIPHNSLSLRFSLPGIEGGS